MDNFFIQPKALEKSAAKKLSGNILQWPNEIIEALYQDFRALSQFPQTVNYVSKDDDRKDAVGQIQINNLIIPFIIENGSLKPFTVCYIDGQHIMQSMPLTETQISKVLFSNSFHKGLTRKKAPDRPPVSYSGVAEVPIKTASLLDQLDGTILLSDKQKVLSELNDPEIAASLIDKQAALDKLEKLAGLKTLTENSDNIEFEEDIHYIYKEAGLGYTKISGNSKVYSPRTSSLRDIDVKQNESLVKSASTSKVVEDLVKSAGILGTIKYDNKNYSVLKLDETLCKEAALLVNTKGDYISELDKEAEWGYTPESVNIPFKKATKGDFVLVKTSSKEFSGPFMVQSAYAVKNAPRIEGIMGFDKLAFVEDTRLSKTVYDLDNSTIYVPKLETVKLASKINLEKPYEKLASRNHFISNRNNEYYLIGPEFKKYAEVSGNAGPYNVHEMSWALIQLGATEDLVKKAQSLVAGEFYIDEKLEAPLTKKAFIEADSKSSKELQAFINSNFRGLIKEAAKLGDPETLDLVLGLNLINEDNIRDLLSNIPNIEGVLNILCKLWLLSATGLRAIDDSLVDNVIKKLSTIKDNLETIANGVK
jgi:hypothetical protein